MASDAVTGIETIHLDHLAVATDLGQDRSRGYCRHPTIALDHRRTRHRQLWTAIAVDQCQSGCHAQPFDGALHGQHGGMQDIQPIDLLHLGAGDAPGQGLFANLVEQHFAARLGEFLRVVQAENRPRRIEDHRSRDHGTAERATTDLVDTRDQFLNQREVEPQLHQSRPASFNTASAANTEASRRSARWITSKPSVCTCPPSINGATA